MKIKHQIITLFSFAVSAFAAASDYSEHCKVAAAWFAGWHEKDFPPKKVPWDKYNHVTYSFALTSPEPTKLDESGLTGLPNFVEEARKHNVKPMLSIGGWTGSRFFSTAVGSPGNRTAFVKTVIEIAKKYNVGGVDFDWEYPNSLGIGCNFHDSKDTANFLSFLQELRDHRDSQQLVITAAAGLSPWIGEDGKPVTDVSGFAKVLDYVVVMNYDVWGAWSQTLGPNSPLNDSCARPENRVGSAVAAIESWTKAGMPVDQIVLGVPTYGHSFRVRRGDAFAKGSITQLALYPPFDAKDQPRGDKWDDQGGTEDVCGVKSTKPGGVITYWGMIALGYINKNGDPKQGRRHAYRFDTCSKTAFSYDSKKEIMVSYDDPQSMRAKGKFIKEQNLRGFAIWEAGGDYRSFLLNAIQGGCR